MALLQQRQRWVRLWPDRKLQRRVAGCGERGEACLEMGGASAQNLCVLRADRGSEGGQVGIDSASTGLFPCVAWWETSPIITILCVCLFVYTSS